MSEQQTNVAQQTQLSEVDFKFRKNKEGFTRETVSLQIPVPTAAAVVAILQDTSEENAKTRSVVMDAVHQIITGYVRGKVDQDENFNQESLEALGEEVSLAKIANLPRSERNTITKDDLVSFAAAYVKYMPDLSGITARSAETAGNIFVARIRPATGNDAVLTKLQARLAEFVEKAPEEVVTEHSTAIEYLMGRLDEALGINYDADAL